MEMKKIGIVRNSICEIHEFPQLFRYSLASIGMKGLFMKLFSFGNSFLI